MNKIIFKFLWKLWTLITYGLTNWERSFKYIKEAFDFYTVFWLYTTNCDKLSFLWLSEADLGLVVTNWGLKVEDELFCGELLCIYFADFCLQFVDFLDFWADGRLENVFELSSLIFDIILQNQRWVLQIRDLCFDNLSQINQIISILTDSIS